MKRKVHAVIQTSCWICGPGFVFPVFTLNFPLAKCVRQIQFMPQSLPLEVKVFPPLPTMKLGEIWFLSLPQIAKGMLDRSLEFRGGKTLIVNIGNGEIRERTKAVCASFRDLARTLLFSQSILDLKF